MIRTPNLVVYIALGLVLSATAAFHSVLLAQTLPVRSAPAIKRTGNQLINPACTMTNKLVLAEYQVWHGLPSHKEPAPYISTDPQVIAGHIQAAQAQCIGGFVVDWYGRPDGSSDHADRKFEDDATAELLRQSAAQGFKVALMYDEGTLRNLPPVDGDYTAQVISDLLYASQYFTLSSYLHLNAQPVVFVFPYEAIDAKINWQTVRQQLGIPITLLDKDPNPSDPTHDAQFDGFYAWVQASTSPWQPGDWGAGYLNWFYQTMITSSYAHKLAVGGAWPGFNDEPAMARRAERYIARRCGQTWFDTWDLIKRYDPAVVMIDTWNDFTEDTDIEHGIIKIAATNTSPTIANQPTELNAAMSDCNGATYTWDFGDGTVGSGATVSHVYTPTGVYTAVVTAAMLTATVTTTTLVQVKSDVIAWQANFDPFALALWQQVSAQWLDLPGPTAKLCEANPNDFSGKAESERIDVNVDQFPLLRIATTAVDPGAHYTVQILDKTTHVATDVLKDIAAPNLNEVNLGEQLQWTGEQSFTINLWLIGEGKCAVFERVSVERSTTEPPLPASTHRQLFLPVIIK